MPRTRNAAGFSLLEALIAASLLAGVIVGLAHLVARAAQQTLGARWTTVAMTLAQSKLEYLRALPWDVDANGAPISSGELALSPPDSLATDMPPYVETLGRFGEPVSLQEGSIYTRRWAIARLAPTDADTLLLMVCVTPSADQTSDTRGACVWGIRTRRP